MPGPSSQYSAVILRVSSSCLEYWVILSTCPTYWPLGLPSAVNEWPGPGRRNWPGEVNANGATCASAGSGTVWIRPAHSVAPGGGGGTHSGCQRSGSLTWSQVLTG